MVNGRDAPCNADSQEDVHRVTSGHVPHARVGVLVLACGHLARERVCNKITYLDPDSPPPYLLASLSSPPSHSLSLIPSHQIYRLSIIPRSHEQQYDTVISFILYIYVPARCMHGWVIGEGGWAHVSRREAAKAAELAAHRDLWQHLATSSIPICSLRFTCLPLHLIKPPYEDHIVEIY